MKRIIYTFTALILTIFSFSCQKVFAIEEDITQTLKETTQENEILLQQNDNNSINFDNDNQQTEELYTDAEVDEKVFQSMEDTVPDTSEESLWNKVLHTKITRTDIPTYLLQDKVNFTLNKGPIGKIQPFATYRGSINALFNSDYSTKYDNLATEIGVMGTLRNPNYKFRMSFFPVPSEHTSYVRNMFSDMYILNTSLPHHQIYLGYSRIQTGMEGGSSTYILPFVARSQIARNFGNKRSLGAKIVGNYEYFDYVFSIGSSSRSLIGGMQGAEFNSWIDVKPFGHREDKFGRLTIGGGFDGGRSLSHNFAVLSGYVGYKYKKLWTNFEVGIADGYHGSTGSHEQRACGYAYTLGWKFTPHWQLIGRIDQFDPDRSVSNNLQREYTIGINWFIKGQALKVILNYVFCQNQNQPNSQKIVVATQVLL